MIVCSCFVVSDHDIKKVARDGKPFHDLKQRTKLGSNCGSCMLGAKQIFDEAQDAAEAAAKNALSSKS